MDDCEVFRFLSSSAGFLRLAHQHVALGSDRYVVVAEALRQEIGIHGSPPSFRILLA